MRWEKLSQHEVDSAGSGSCPMVGFGINCVEPSGSATWELIGKMDLRETGFGNGRWMQLAQDSAHWLALVSTTQELLKVQSWYLKGRGFHRTFQYVPISINIGLNNNGGHAVA
jgi:hypothetical protein